MIAAWLAFVALAAQTAESRIATTGSVPFVGCEADGQVGPVAAPPARPVPPVPARAAAHLAYYASEQMGVLAPRGWHCFETYGSNGSNLFVMPDSHPADWFFDWDQQIEGPGIVLTFRYGGTSGRWAVATMIARHFPRYRSFLRDQFQGLDLGEMPDGPYPDDSVRRTGETSLEFATPAGRRGLGTDGALGPGRPVSGLVMLFPAEDMNMVKLEVRLPAGSDADLEPIMAAVRRQYSGRSPAN